MSRIQNRHSHLLSLIAVSGIFAATNIAVAAETGSPASQPRSIEVTAASVTDETAAEQQVARITGVTGPDTRVNAGDGYVPAKVGMLLSEGDGLLAGPGSQISISFIDQKCTLVVGPEDYASVPRGGSVSVEPAACPPATEARLEDKMVGSVVVPTADVPSEEPERRSIVPFLFVGAAAAGAVAFTLLDDDDNDNSNRVSPD